jgi:hypothetical protein
MLTVFKYDFQKKVSLPGGARILRVDQQGMGLKVWALVDLAITETTVRKLILVGTGDVMDLKMDELSYINTLFESDGALVWHVFEVLK